MKVVRKTVEGVKLIIATMVRFDLVAVWHCERHQLMKAEAIKTKRWVWT